MYDIKFFIIPLFLILASCTTHDNVDTFVKHAGFQKQWLKGDGFSHLTFTNPAIHRNHLHVYIEGDGLPWRNRFIIASDPTPRNPMMLQLMQLDKNPSLYLGRPCYFERHISKNCNSALWTFHRYSQKVVASMAKVLTDYMLKAAYQQVSFYAHSGGGTLAMLLAKQIKTTVGVVTIGANIDPEAWTTHHHYTPLYGSLNPVDYALNPTIKQWHYVGRNDTNVPVQLLANALRKQANAQLKIIEQYDHHCCWIKIWAKILARFEEEMRKK